MASLLMKEVALVMALLVGGGCDSNLEVKTASLPAEAEPEPDTHGLTNKIVDSTCVDPDMSQIPTTIEFTLCNGNLGRGALDLTALSAENIREGVTIGGIVGVATFETHTSCTVDGQAGCVAVGPAFRAAAVGGITPADIRAGIVVAGISGAGSVETHVNCSSDGATGCVVTGSFAAADMTQVVAGNIRSGVTIAGRLGTYPSLATPLVGATPTADLTSLAATTPAGGYEFFDSAGVRYTGNISDAGTVTPGTSNQTFNISLYRQFTVAGDGNLTAGNVKNGVALFGVTGAYPSAGFPMAGSDGTADLPAFAATVGGATYEWFKPDGTRLTGAIQANTTVASGVADQTLDAGLYRSVMVTGDADLLTTNIRSGVNILGVIGTVTPSAADCSSDGEVGCVTTVAYKAADMANVIPSNIKDTIVIAGVTGTLSGAPVNCSSNGEVGCVTTGSYKAADLSNLLSGNVKNGVTIAGVAGTYPSLASPLAGATATSDLTSMAAATPAGNYEFFDSTGTRYAGAISDAGSVASGTSDQVFNTSLYRAFTVTGDSDLTGANIKSGANILGVAGSVTAAPADCASNAEVGCVTTTTFKAADLSNLTAAHIKKNVVVAGVTGDYPSATNPLAGADATTDLPDFASTAGATSYEWFKSDGTRVTGAIEANETVTPSAANQVLNDGLYRSVTVSGDADLVAGNIKSGVTLFGVAGSVDAAPANCSSNAEVGCVTTSTFKAADLSNLTAGNIKKSLVLAGVTGDYPSATNPLAGANGTTDLPAFASTAGGATYEWFQSDGTRVTDAVEANATATPGTADQTFSAGLYRSVTVSGDADLVAGNVKNGVTLFGVAGNVVPSAANCSSDGEVGCVTTASYKAANMVNVIPSNIKDTIVIAGVTGTLSGSPANCSSNGEMGCVTTSTYKAADLTNLVSGNIKNGVTIAGTAGTYPSLATPLAGATGTSDLTSLAATTPAGSYEFFDSVGTRYAGSINDAGTITPSTSNQSFSTSLYRQFTVQGDADLVAANITTGVQIFGVTGTAAPAPANCASNGETGCVTTSTYKAADLTNLNAGNIKSGAVVAGVTGTYPSVATPLAGATATSDLTSMAATTPAGSYEFFDSAGARYTGSISDAGTVTPGASSQSFATSLYRQFTVGGDTDLAAGNIATGVNIFGVSGTLTPSPANCAADGVTGCVTTATYKSANTSAFAAGDLKSGKTVAGVAGTLADCAADGGVGCVTTASYKAANMSNVTAGNLKSGVVVAGVTGDFPSSTYPLTGAGATADLVSATFNSQVKSATAFEYWDSTGARQTGAGSANITAANIANGVAIFGTTGTATLETHSPCASDGATGCVTTATFKAADMSLAVAGNIRSGVTVASTVGTYGPACAADGGTACLVDGTTYKAAKLSNFVAGDVKTGVTIAGVAGSATIESHSNCAVDGATGCVAVAAFKAADMSNVVSGTIKNGVTIAGVAGTYPSLATPLAGASATGDLTSLAATTAAGSYEFWDSTGTRYTGSITDAGTITPGASNQSFTASLYRQFTVAGDADLIATNIKSGITVFGVAGSVTAETHSNCSTDGAIGCVTVAAYKAANMTNAIATNIKSGVTIAGVAGSVTVESHSNCAADGGSGCVVDGTNYKAASTSTLSAGNIKSGVTIGGVAGQYPSATYKLTGADATADLDTSTFDAKIKSSTSFEWFDANGTRYTNSGDADITAANIGSGITIFGTTGTIANTTCSADGQTNCITTSQYKSADTNAYTTWDIRKGKTVGGKAGAIAFYKNMIGSFNNTTSPAVSGSDVWDTIDDYNNNGAFPNTAPTGWDQATGANWVMDSTNDTGVGSGISGDNICNGTEACVFKDQIADLMWAKDNGTSYTWQNAITQCNNLTFGGYSDWRLPTQKEILQAYTDGIWSLKATNKLSLSTSTYWTATTRADDTTDAASVYLSLGDIWFDGKATGARVLCVR